MPQNPPNRAVNSVIPQQRQNPAPPQRQISPSARPYQSDQPYTTTNIPTPFLPANLPPRQPSNHQPQNIYQSDQPASGPQSQPSQPPVIPNFGHPFPPLHGHQTAEPNSQTSPNLTSPVNLTPNPPLSPHLPFNHMPTHEIEINRRKRHILTPLFSYITGLASTDDIQKLHDNENSLLKAEETLISQMDKVRTQTNTVVSAIREQSSQIADIYKDEIEVKETLQALLGDTNDALQQVRGLTAALEIFSDISVEFQAIFNIIDLLPELIKDIHDSISALASQSVTANLLPSEDIGLKIPHHRRASLLAAHISAAIDADAFHIIVSLPEFYPVFTAYAIKTVPFHPTPPDNFYTLQIDQLPIAMNNEKNLFQYNPALCESKNAITICSPHLITLKHKPTTCAETLLTNNNENIKICYETAAIFKPTAQSYIYMDNMSKIRLFSPYQDSLTHICGSIIRTNATIIEVGYTDLKFKSGCTLKSAELTLVSPVPPVDTTDIQVESQMPDLAQSFDALQNSIQTVHSINLTQLTTDFNKLSEYISHEKIDFKSAQSVLKKAASMQALAEFSMLSPTLDEPDSLTTTVKVVSYMSLLGTLLLTILALHCCCPGLTTPIIVLAKRLITTLCACTVSCCQTFTKKRRFAQLPTMPNINLLTPRSMRRNTGSAPPMSPRYQTPTVKFQNNPDSLESGIESHLLSTAYTDVQNQLARASALYESTPHTTSQGASGNNEPNWEIVQNTYRARLRVKFGETQIFYNSIKNCCVDPDGTINTTCALPPKSLIKLLHMTVANLPHPPMISIDNSLRLAENTNVIFDDIDSLLIDNVSRQILDGYNLPLKPH